MDPSLLEQTLHLDLKRDLSTHTFAKRENITLPDGGLFERYQYFTPGMLPSTSKVIIYHCFHNPLTSKHRYIHGSRSRFHPPDDPLRRHLRARQPASVIRSLRQRAGTTGDEEGAITALMVSTQRFRCTCMYRFMAGGLCQLGCVSNSAGIPEHDARLERTELEQESQLSATKCC